MYDKIAPLDPTKAPAIINIELLSEKPILAVLHENSTASNVIVSTGAGQTLCFNGIDGLGDIESDFDKAINQFRQFAREFDPKFVNHSLFEEYSAKEIKSLKRDLVNQKNSYMNDLRGIRRRKEKESNSASTSKERKEITSKFTPKISALGERIDRIREKIEILND
jgi:hypothetical protein